MARKQLMGKYSTVILSYFLVQLIISFGLNLATPRSSLYINEVMVYCAVSFILVLFEGIFIVGQNYLYLRIQRENECSVSDMWYGFKNQPDKAIAIRFLIFLANVIAAIPFCISAFMYSSKTRTFSITLCVFTFILFAVAATYLQLLFSQAFYLFIDRPELKALELMKCSIKLMNGHKAKLLYIILSFIGMYLLAMLTLGIGLLWVAPYMNMVKANFYAELTKTPASTIDISV